MTPYYQNIYAVFNITWNSSMRINISDDQQKLAHIFPDIMFTSWHQSEYVIGVIPIDDMCQASIRISSPESQFTHSFEKTYVFKSNYGVCVRNSNDYILAKNYDKLDDAIDLVDSMRTEDKFKGG
jgi:hypothetical protein